ncbi:MAG TPA: carbamoyltransferase C-terminal domain-containing protein [Allosphingosinicella sp.]|nr:carbamoyltransferase C-terminal domain-containing protein [Allosphingosinicella sp.]
MSVYYIGLSVTGHDPAFAIVDSAGRLVFAEATERYLQDKRAWGAAPDHFDHLAGPLGRYCADATRFVVAASWARVKHWEQVPGEEGAPSADIIDPVNAFWLREHQRRAFEHFGLNVPRIAPGVSVERRAYDHHLCHAAYAAASSPFEDAHCLIVDGEGEVGSVSLYAMRERRLTRRWRSWGPGSLGYLYGFVTGRCGFDWRRGEEWKVMGLAAFGRPVPEAVESLKRLVWIENGRPRTGDASLWNDAGIALGRWSRDRSEDVMAAADLAASGQAAYGALADEVLAAIGCAPGDNLLLGGGCALNSSYNGTLRTRFGLGAVHVPPAPADDGNAAGAALLAWQEDNEGAALPYCPSPYLGSEPDPKAVAGAIAHGGFGRVSERGGDSRRVAELLAGGAVIGVMRGRAEFGPRALGDRSILADPRPPEMKDRLNREVKGREPYRPFAPIVAEEEAERWFEDAGPSPYMSFAHRWRADKAKRVPAVVHADGTGRLQTVSGESNPWLCALLRDFDEASGVPILLNTSLNVMGKPIVHGVEDALAILMTTGLDALVVDEVLIEKSAG